MPRRHELPPFVVEFLMYRKSRSPGKIVEAPKDGSRPRQRNLPLVDFTLVGAGRAIGNARTAADYLEEIHDKILAEYHAYAGVSAARTSIDAIATWLWRRLRIGVRIRSVSFTNEEFVRRLTSQRPALEIHVRALGDLAREIDLHRTRAQHREGLPLVHYISNGKSWWMLAPKGIRFPRDEDIHLSEKLREWVSDVEERLRQILMAM